MVKKLFDFKVGQANLSILEYLKIAQVRKYERKHSEMWVSKYFMTFLIAGNTSGGGPEEKPSCFMI